MSMVKGIGRYGEPRSDHWESDYARSSCAAPDCNEPLAMFFRHHCRRCGKLFCPKCVGGGLQRRLNQNAELNPRGVLLPVCYECYVEENGWFSERGSAAWNEATNSAFVDRTGSELRPQRPAHTPVVPLVVEPATNSSAVSAPWLLGALTYGHALQLSS